ncbi:sodium-dependent transporter [Dethiothermospora halolimnae]|uniref:sodium-dependent transporter n=1 Tax=Dethiothermospora halolimnae TaxID=3114390 RepID=UPI003CCBD204
MKREGFGSKFGVLAAAAGSAIGLGNIWKFPYIAGENGGAAFIFLYLFFILLLGVPLMVSELVIGRKGQSNVVRAFKKLAPNTKWHYTGILGVSTAFILFSFYSAVAGWIFAYVSRSISGDLISISPDKLGSYFNGIISSNIEPLIWQFIVIAFTAFIVIAGIKKGVEKYSKILMPVLFGLLVILAVRSVTLEGASKGIEFLFKPDFASLTGKGILEALGHAFFSLSLGMGTLVTYGSYINKKENLQTMALQITMADTLIALIAGLVIFPAVFAYGFQPDQGPELIFITLPAVFKEMPLGGIFQSLFFVLVGIAALTSTISLLEIIVSYFTEEYKISRKKVTIIVSFIIFLLGIPNTLSFGILENVKLFDKTIFDLFNFSVSNVMLPLGGLLIALFVGKVWGTKNAINEATNDGKIDFPLAKGYTIIIKYIAPVAIIIILLYSTGIL